MGNYFLQQTELEKFVFFLNLSLSITHIPSCSQILENDKHLPMIFQLDIREFDMIVEYTFYQAIWHRNHIKLFCLNVDILFNFYS